MIIKLNSRTQDMGYPTTALLEEDEEEEEEAEEYRH
jgi:hypothetical protein